ncbi:hypothetical protein D1AOALGA4SA_2734 [Olavius algarvensis Delta 1 endosymbiont]|nr:hypothetical protein D1AOALGA4SA_2734 [Olavius algarvensis Delta 1 endosymbiont]
MSLPNPPKGPKSFCIASGEIWCPELACGEPAESAEGQKSVLSLPAVSLPNPPAVSLPNPPAVSLPNPPKGKKVS